jgi:hypothetical protein
MIYFPFPAIRSALTVRVPTVAVSYDFASRFSSTFSISSSAFSIKAQNRSCPVAGNFFFPILTKRVFDD